MWIVVRIGKYVMYQTYYILDTERHLLRNICVQYPRKNLDHYLILGFLCITTLRENSKYIRRRMQPPLHPLETPTRDDHIIVDILKVVSKPKGWEERENSCILESTCRLIKKIVSVHQEPIQYQQLLRSLGRNNKARLQEEIQHQAHTTRADIKSLLVSDPP